MKTGFFSLTIAVLLHIATSQPHRKATDVFQNLKQGADVQTPEPYLRRGSHRHHAKRADTSCASDAAVVTNIATAIDTVTYQFQDIIVYMDDSNKPVSTTTKFRNLVSSTPAPTPSSTPVTSAAPVKAPPPRSQPASSPLLPPHKSSPAPAPAPAQPKKPGSEPAHPSQPKPPSSPAPPKSSSSPSPPRNNGGGASSGPGFGSAVSYTPYNTDNSCKSAQQVSKDLAKASDFEVLRLYGTDCNQVANVLAATKGNIKLFLGIFDINQIQSEVQKISSAVNGNWGVVNAINVGNELVNSGKASAGQVTAAIGIARSALKAAGYSGPVVTVDTMIAMKNHPELCRASDFCAINCHAFFDGNVLPEGAGDFVKKWAKQVSDAAGGKTVVVTESGWPTKGGTNNKAVASQENHQKAISSLRSAFNGGTNLILFGMYNEGWKKDRADTHGCEKYWGLYGDAPS